MSKHNQSAALGTLSDFTSTPNTPEDRLERIESRFENIEKLLNTVLYAVSDLNETVDQVSKQPQSKKQAAPTHPKSPARSPARGKRKPEKGKSSSANSQYTPEQMIEINRCKPEVCQLLSDRESLTKAETVEMLPDMDPKLIGRVLHVLSSEGFLSMEKPKATPKNPDPKVVFRRNK